jgi:hypothetical protein
VIYTQHGSDPETGIGEITPRKSASIRQPHWHRHLDVKRPTLSCDLRRVVRSQSAVWRQPVKLGAFTRRFAAWLLSRSTPDVAPDLRHFDTPKKILSELPILCHRSS